MYYFTLGVTPMVFLSGVFFPVAQLPHALVQVVKVLPLAPAIELMRPLVLGRLPADPLPDLLQLAATALLTMWLAIALMRRRLLR